MFTPIDPRQAQESKMTGFSVFYRDLVFNSREDALEFMESVTQPMDSRLVDRALTLRVDSRVDGALTTLQDKCAEAETEYEAQPVINGHRWA